MSKPKSMSDLVNAELAGKTIDDEVDEALQADETSEADAPEADQEDEVVDGEVAGDEAEKTDPATTPKVSDPKVSDPKAPGLKATDPKLSGDKQTEASPAPEKTKFSLLDRVAKDGYDTEGLDEGTIADALLARLKQLEDLSKREQDRKAAEAVTKLVDDKPTDAKPVGAEDKPARERKLKPLKKPDADLDALVEFDPDTKLAVPIDRFGEAGRDAARQINAYYKEKQKRAEQWFEDPASLIFDDLKDDVDGMIAAKFKEFLDQQKSQEQEVQKQQVALTETQRVQAWFDQHKADIWNLDANGQPKKGMLSGTTQLTERGKQFELTWQELQDLNPTADPVKILEKAYKLAQVNQVAPAPAPASTPIVTPEDKKAAGVEKKKKFIEKRKHESVPGNRRPSTMQDKINGGVKVSLWNALFEDSANDENPALAPFRK